VLLHKSEHYKPAEKRGKFIIGTSIHQRPKDVKKEKPSVIGNLIPLLQVEVKAKVVCKIRLYIENKIANKITTYIERAIKLLHTIIPQNPYITATVDIVKEFTHYRNI
jgi:IS30 family transposase